MVYTCTRCGKRAETIAILQPAGSREGIACPTHGVIAYRGWKPTGGIAGVRALPAAQLAPNEYGPLKLGSLALWQARPPRGTTVVLHLLPVTEDAPDGTITVDGYIDTPNWRGWLEAGVWLEEEQ